MAKISKRLTARRVETVSKPGMYADGDGLYLQVTSATAKSWIYRFMLNGKAREMGLGPLWKVSLTEARDFAGKHRKQRFDGIDPIGAKRDAERAACAAKQQEAAESITFAECASAYIKSHKAGWKNAKHAAQWTATLDTFAGPVIGTKPVKAVDTELVMEVIKPLWANKTETASRLRGRIEVILDWAKTSGYRDGENPARWRGHLQNLLPARSKVQKVEHHPALPYAVIGAFIDELGRQDGVAARALEFLILAAARTGEVIGARWPEIDFDNKVWTIPAERMKAGREHRVPLAERALAILEEMKRDRPEGNDFLFPGGKPRAPLSNMALLALLKRMGRGDLTTHGFRSTFRDWTAERTSYPREVAEMALAHTIGDKVEAAYRRGDLFEKRRRLMQEWAKFCGMVMKATSNNVAQLAERRA